MVQKTIPSRTSVTVKHPELKVWLTEQMAKERFRSVNHACNYALIKLMEEEKDAGPSD